MVKTVLPMQRAWVQFLVRELRSHMLCTVAKQLNKKNKTNKNPNLYHYCPVES